MFSIFLCLTWVHSNSSWGAVNWHLCRKLLTPQDQWYTWWSDMHILEMYELLSYDRSWGTMVNLHNNKPASRPENNGTSWCKPCHVFCTCLPFGLHMFAMWFHMFYTCLPFVLHVFAMWLPCRVCHVIAICLSGVCYLFAILVAICSSCVCHMFSTCLSQWDQMALRTMAPHGQVYHLLVSWPHIIKTMTFNNVLHNWKLKKMTTDYTFVKFDPSTMAMSTVLYL